MFGRIIQSGGLHDPRLKVISCIPWYSTCVLFLIYTRGYGGNAQFEFECNYNNCGDMHNSCYYKCLILRRAQNKDERLINELVGRSLFGGLDSALSPER